ncbi:hypothetical protein RJ640_015010, partial [Escallonia rubra]
SPSPNPPSTPNSSPQKPRFLITRTLNLSPISPFPENPPSPQPPIWTPLSRKRDPPPPPNRYPLEKLFFPPETDVSSLTTLLSTRLILKGSNIVLSHYARDAQVAQAEFVKSSVRTEDCPADGLPEFALVGRWNVGKSSLLNSLDTIINQFRINDSWFLMKGSEISKTHDINWNIKDT